MRGKMLVVLAIVSALAVTLSACGPTPEPVVNTVVVQQTVAVKETVLVKETSVVKETVPVEQTVQVVVTPTPLPHPEAIIQGSSPMPKSQSGLSGSRRPSTTMSKARSPALRKRIPASR